MAKKATLPKGVTCKKCKQFSSFSSWMYAHWNEPLVFTCQTCDTAWNMRRGRITSRAKVEKSE